MTPILIASLASFISGVLGYIITRYWLRPIFAYRRIKRRIDSGLRDYVKIIDRGGEIPRKNQEITQYVTELRKNCTELTSCYNNDLPYWYKLKLQSLSESPEKAAGEIMPLGNIRICEHAIRRVEKAKKALSFK